MYGVPRAKLEAANHVHADTVLRPGQKLEIPLVAGRHVAETAPEPVPATHTALAKPNQAPGTPVADATAPVPQKMAALPAQPEPSVLMAQEPKPTLDGGRSDPKAAPSFRWPVRGRIIEGFGATAGASRNDGINLAVPEGTSVKSAEDGEVIYSGNELKGYGNLILVRHANGYVTAYAHASELLVKRGDTIKRGQVIAKSGQSGEVASPQLHFEIRRGSTPVDPLQFLNGA
jgi:murein DD-endopeptidase MepM/ murein hydrolase activator NlpD